MTKPLKDVEDRMQRARAWITRSPLACFVFHTSFLLAAFVLILLAFSSAAHAQLWSVPKPTIMIEKSGRCVADKETMRREHMNLLKHQRDRTVHEGVRTPTYSLSGCIDCHASSQNQSVIGTKDNFCQSCHAYVGVTLDCFECHTPKPATPIAPPRADRATRFAPAGKPAP